MSHDIFDYHCGCGSYFTVAVPSSKGIKEGHVPKCPSCGNEVKEGTPSRVPNPIKESLQMGDGASQMRFF